MHWKKLTNPAYLGAYSLEEDGTYVNRIVTIKSVAVEMVKNTDGKEESCVVAQLVDEKPFILNKTNLKAIEAATGTPDVDKWRNLSVELTVQKVRAFGTTTDALRVVPKKPALPVLDANHKHFAQICERVQGGTLTIEQVKSKYSLSKEVETLILGTNE